MLTIFNRDIFDPPSLLEQILTSPISFLTSTLHHIFTRLRSPPTKPPSSTRLEIVCISDTHTHTYSPIPPGDILIHAGDLSNAGTVSEIQAQIDWLSAQPHRYKLAIAGNHDTFQDERSRKTLPADEQEKELDWKDVQYLQHSSTLLKFDSGRSLVIYGAPQIPRCGDDEFAFQYERGQDAWSDTIPKRIDVLVTHTPPKYHRDLSEPWLGCEFLLRECWRVRPAVHVFGHIHAGAGRETVYWDDAQTVYEGALERGSGQGFVKQVLNPWLWVGLVKVVVHGVVNLLWDRIWAGDIRATIMVNSALMVNNSGKLGNKVQVVEV